MSSYDVARLVRAACSMSRFDSGSSELWLRIRDAALALFILKRRREPFF